MPLRKSAFPIALVTLLLLPLAGDRSPALRSLVGRANAAVEPAKDKNYDLTSLELFRRSVVQVKDNYVEPARINPKEMFVAALEAVEKQVPEVMVEPGTPPCEEPKGGREPGTAAAAAVNSRRCGSGRVPEGKVRVTVGASSRDFEYGEIANVWQIPLKMRDVFAFLKEHIVSQSDQREIEYAAVNGMLSTLDPHSWLLKPDLY
jgi:carboxyl-terminal processing protease